VREQNLTCDIKEVGVHVCVCLCCTLHVQVTYICIPTMFWLFSTDFPTTLIDGSKPPPFQFPSRTAACSTQHLEWPRVSLSLHVFLPCQHESSLETNSLNWQEYGAPRAIELNAIELLSVIRLFDLSLEHSLHDRMCMTCHSHLHARCTFCMFCAG